MSKIFLSAVAISAGLLAAPTLAAGSVEGSLNILLMEELHRLVSEAGDQPGGAASLASGEDLAPGQDLAPGEDLVPGCGFTPNSSRSCWKVRSESSGPTCGTGNLSRDPWATSSSLFGEDYRASPHFEDIRVRRELNARYGWREPRPAGYLPLGGPWREPWAEGLPTAIAGLKWACSHRDQMPLAIRSRMADANTHDMNLTDREVLDLIFMGGARSIFRTVRAIRDGATGPPPNRRVVKIVSAVEDGRLYLDAMGAEGSLSCEFKLSPSPRTVRGCHVSVPREDGEYVVLLRVRWPDAHFSLANIRVTVRGDADPLPDPDPKPNPRPGGGLECPAGYFCLVETDGSIRMFQEVNPDASTSSMSLTLGLPSLREMPRYELMLAASGLRRRR